MISSFDTQQPSAPSTSKTPAAPTSCGTLVLRVFDRSDGGYSVHHIEGPRCSLGASPTCTVRLRGPNVRPVHCVILRGRHRSAVRRWSPNSWLNGQFFNDDVIAEGDELTLGGVRVQVAEDNRPLVPTEPERDPGTPLPFKPTEVPGLPAWQSDEPSDTLIARVRAAEARISQLTRELVRSQTQWVQAAEKSPEPQPSASQPSAAATPSPVSNSVSDETSPHDLTLAEAQLAWEFEREELRAELARLQDYASCLEEQTELSDFTLGDRKLRGGDQLIFDLQLPIVTSNEQIEEQVEARSTIGFSSSYWATAHAEVDERLREVQDQQQQLAEQAIEQQDRDEQLTARHQNLEEWACQLDQFRLELDGRAEEVEQQAAANALTVEELSAQLATARVEADETQATHAARESIWEEQQVEWKAESEQLRQKVAELEQTVTHLEQTVTHLEEDATAHVGQGEHDRQAIVSLEANVQSLQHELEAARAIEVPDPSVQAAEIERRLEEERSVWRAERESLEQELEALKQTAAEKASPLETNDGLSAVMAEVERELTQMNADEGNSTPLAAATMQDDPVHGDPVHTEAAPSELHQVTAEDFAADLAETSPAAEAAANESLPTEILAPADEPAFGAEDHAFPTAADYLQEQAEAAAELEHHATASEVHEPSDFEPLGEAHHAEMVHDPAAPLDAQLERPEQETDGAVESEAGCDVESVEASLVSDPSIDETPQTPPHELNDAIEPAPFDLEESWTQVIEEAAQEAQLVSEAPEVEASSDWDVATDDPTAEPTESEAEAEMLARLRELVADVSPATTDDSSSDAEIDSIPGSDEGNAWLTDHIGDQAESATEPSEAFAEEDAEAEQDAWGVEETKEKDDAAERFESLTDSFEDDGSDWFDAVDDASDSEADDESSEEASGESAPVSFLEQYEAENADLFDSAPETSDGPSDEEAHHVEAPPTPGEAGEDSIEDYMQQLLQRVGHGDGVVIQEVETAIAPSTGTKPKPVNEAKPKPPRRPKPDPIANLSAMRELANASARDAINQHETKRYEDSAFSNLGITIAAVLIGAILLVFSRFQINLLAGLGVAVELAAIYFGFRSFSSGAVAVFQRFGKKNGDDKNGDDASAGRRGPPGRTFGR